jgi:ribosomal protein S18 acetylase RimI-like enzyme
MQSPDIPVLPCPPEARSPALRALHDGLSKDLQSGLVVALEAVDLTTADSALDGLFVAFSGAKLAAVWIQRMPGNMAVVWPPAFDSPACLALLHEAGRYLDRYGIGLAQILVAPRSSAQVELLSAGQFFHLADLQYLVAEKSAFPSEPLATSLRYETAAADFPERLSRVILRTYEATCDCPALGGLRKIGDVLAGYRSTGHYLRDQWCFVRAGDQDVGVLILADHRPAPHWELVYMGVVPEARGHEFGWQIARQAMWRAGQGGAGRLILAVDQANAPALAMYARAGFVGWECRQVFARLSSGQRFS